MVPRKLTKPTDKINPHKDLGQIAKVEANFELAKDVATLWFQYDPLHVAIRKGS